MPKNIKERLVTYEIEHRAVLTEEAYEALKGRLLSETTMIGEDDKEVLYYIYSDKLLKVVKNLSKNTAVLSLKLNVLGQGSLFQEIDIPFSMESFEDMERVCNEIALADQVISGTQKRTNFSYDDVEIALKWSEDWGYHVEFEIIITNKSLKESANQKIHTVAKHFNITLMTEEEVKTFLVNVQAKHKG